MMAREAHKAAFASLLGRDESFDGSSRGEDLLNFVHCGNLVNLPEIDVIGLQGAQGLVEIRLGSLAATLRGLSGQENILSEGRQDISIHLFRSSIPVYAGIVKIIDAEFVGAQGNGLRVLVAAHGKSAARLSDDRQLLTRSSQCPLWDVYRLYLARLGAARGRGKSGRCGNSEKSSASHIRSLPS